MKILTWCPGVLLLVAQVAPAAPPNEAATADLARLLHKVIVAKLPPVYENASAWGHTVPVPERMRLPRLRRTFVRVGDHDEVPDGPWRKVRLRLEDPNRDLQVRVLSFKRVEAMTYRVVVETDAAVRAEADVQRWRNGLQLADLTARADVLLNVRVECDVSARVAGKGLVLEPVINDLKLNLKEFTPRQVTFHRTGVVLAGDRVEAAGEELKEPLQEMLRSIEPDVKRRAGEALARALKEGKEPLPAAEVLRAVAPLLGQK